MAIVSLARSLECTCQAPLSMYRDTDASTDFTLQQVRPSVLHACMSNTNDAQTVPQNCNMHLAQLHKQTVRTPDAQTAPGCSDSQWVKIVDKVPTGYVMTSGIRILASHTEMEMCYNEHQESWHPLRLTRPVYTSHMARQFFTAPVSYTHLTLPTILRV